MCVGRQGRTLWVAGGWGGEGPRVCIDSHPRRFLHVQHLVVQHKQLSFALGNRRSISIPAHLQLIKLHAQTLQLALLVPYLQLNLVKAAGHHQVNVLCCGQVLQACIRPSDTSAMHRIYHRAGGEGGRQPFTASPLGGWGTHTDATAGLMRRVRYLLVINTVKTLYIHQVSVRRALSTRHMKD